MVLQGLLFGSAAVLGMLNPLEVAPGIILDGRSIMVSLCALFFGPWAAAVSGITALTFRLWLGGVGATTGAIIVFSSAGIGLLAHYRLRPRTRPPSAWTLCLFGVVVHLAMLALLFTLPGDAGKTVVLRIGPALMLLFPLATVLAGKILSDRVSAARTLADLQHTRENLAITLQSIGDAVISTDLKARIVFMNPIAEELTGWSLKDARGKPFNRVFHIIHEETREEMEDPVGKVLRVGGIMGLSNHVLLVAKDGTERPIADSASPIRDVLGEIAGVVLVFRDRSEQRRVRRLMQARPVLLDYATRHTPDELLTRALDEICVLADSPIGFCRLLKPRWASLAPLHWSTRTLGEFCEVRGQNAHNSEKPGSWADCILRKSPVVHNDFASLPQEKGLPEGHPDLARFLAVPILREGEVVAVVGVGNKRTEYTEKDVDAVANLSDITWQILEKRHTEEELEQSEALFRNLFQGHAAVKLIIDPETGEIIDANQAAEKYYGWPRETLRRMRVHDLNTLSAQEVELEIEKARNLQRVYFEFRHRRADGSIRDVEVFSSKIRVRDRDLLHSVVHDVTERRRFEKTLKESERKYRDLFENAPIGIFTTDSEGRALSCNKAMARILGFGSPQEAVERFTDLQSQLYVTPSRRDRFLELLREKGQVENFEYQAHTADGRTAWLIMNARIASRHDDGSFVIEGFTTDISEQRDLEEQIQQSHKMESVGRLAGGVAHDYNNMLSVILGYAELAMAGVDPDKPLYGDLQEIYNAARRSTQITRQLLAFARKQTINPKVLSLNDTVEGMLKMLRRLIGEDIDLAWLPKAGAWRVRMDPAQVDQILANLCVNARDAIGGVGKLTIETDNVTFDKAYCRDHAGFAPGDFVMLAVSDDGCGMAPETLSTIFEPFFTTKDASQGTGLGLATVYGIVKQNDGFINVYSELGKGTTFKIYLPRHLGTGEETRAASPTETPLGRGETLLLVEDEPAIMKMGLTMLEKMGYRILTAGTPSDAMRLAREFTEGIHLLITDVVMPEMNGRDLADRLITLHPGLKVLFMSGYTANVIAHHGVLEEGVNFIQKPFSAKELAFKVRGALDGN